MNRTQNFTREQLYFLASSEKFQDILDNDPVLHQLDDASDDPEMELVLQKNVFHLPDAIGVLPVNPLTPSVWMKLISSGNPFAAGGIVEPHHREEFLSLLNGGGKNCCRKTGLAAGDISESIRLRIRAAFLPWDRDIAIHDNAPDVSDHVPWLVMVCSYAAQMSATPIRQVAENMSLSLVIMLYGIQWHILNRGQDCLPVTQPDRNAEKILNRTYELGKKFLAETHFNA